MEQSYAGKGKHERLSAWDVAYALDMAIACLITYWIMTGVLFRFVDTPTDLLGGMWVLRLVDTAVGIAVGVTYSRFYLMVSLEE